jgi:hypothetical protein
MEKTWKKGRFILISDGDVARIDRLAGATSALAAQFPGSVMPKFHAAAREPR